MGHQPNHELYEKLLDQFDEFEQKIVRIEEIKKDKDYTKCTCGAKDSHHASECKIHPYLKIILMNPDDLEVSVESFLLVPIKWDGKILDNAEEATKTRTVEPVSSPKEAAVLEIAVQQPVVVQDDENVRQAMETIPNIAKGRYAFVLITKDRGIKVEDVFSCNDPNLIFDEQEKHWLYADMGANLGEVVFFGEDKKDGFVGVIEADPSHLLLLISAMGCYQTEIIRWLLIERMKEPI